jgi:CRP-like cAMP-binding protein
MSLPAQAGDISGTFPFSRMKQFTVTGRAMTDGRLLKFPAALFPELIQKMPELTATLVAMMSDRIREGTRIEQQHDRLVSLGKLSAGLAHELNTYMTLLVLHSFGDTLRSGRRRIHETTIER